MPLRSLLAAAIVPAAWAVKEAYEELAPEVLDGSTADLSEEGYQSVAALKSTEEMEVFVRRVIEGEGLVVTGEHHLQGMVPFYSGHCATQSLDLLVQEVHHGQERKNKCKPAWVASAAGDSQQESFLQTKKQLPPRPSFFAWLFGLGSEPSAAGEAPQAEEAAAPAQAVDSFASHAGMFASLDNRGYMAVAASRSKAEMAMFVHRLLKEMKVRVKDEGGLQAILPYYDGECDVQSFGNLQAELDRGLARPDDCMGGPWLERM